MCSVSSKFIVVILSLLTLGLVSFCQNVIIIILIIIVSMDRFIIIITIRLLSFVIIIVIINILRYVCDQEIRSHRFVRHGAESVQLNNNALLLFQNIIQTH